MMTAICKVPGTYLVRDSVLPIPIGKSEADVSTVVHEYKFGWICEDCGPKKNCIHIKTAIKVKEDDGE